ncbi:MAG TPA: hypothetical protein VK432_10560 [Stellaceae bacterium]|nr:hypothetical protein [Stellaceae bacterium]
MVKWVGAAVALLYFTGVAVAYDPQPHAHAALDALQNALHEIEIADQAHDHGGYAGAATRSIQQAIQQLQQAIAYRDAHSP